MTANRGEGALAERLRLRAEHRAEVEVRRTEAHQRALAVKEGEAALLRQQFAGQPLTPAEAQRQESIAALEAFGGGMNPDGSVRLPRPPADLHEKFFARTDEQLFKALGLANALAAAQATRAGRALALAQAGALTADEVRHLEWLTTTTRPELVRPDTVPLTKEDAEKALDAHRARR